MSSALALAADSGNLWLADETAGQTRVDRFDAASGVFLGPQLDEEGGVSLLGSAGVAVAHPSGEEVLYAGAGESGQGVVAVFGPGGKLQHTWTGANTPSGPFGFLTGVAADSSVGLESSGDVYVASSGPNVVDVFKPVAGGAEPAKVVAQLKGICPAMGATCGLAEQEEEANLFKGPTGVAVSGFNGDVLVADGSSVVDVFEPTLLGEYRFVRQLTGTPTGPSGAEVPFADVTALTVDATSGDIYVSDNGARFAVVDEFDLEGKYEGRLASSTASISGLAVDSASGDVYVGHAHPEPNQAPVEVFGANIFVPNVTTTPASAPAVSADGQIDAVLNGAVNPAGQGAASCRFAWGTTEAFGQFAACEPESIVEGSTEVPVHTTLTGLAPDTSYSFRLQASNKNGTNPGDEGENQTFTTPGPGFGLESALSVSSSSATLEATIGPHGAPTSFYFQYSTSPEYSDAVDAPAAPGIPLGAGEEEVQVPSQHIQGLSGGTLYHYRVVAVSRLEVAGTPTLVSFPGADHTFTTQAASGGSSLPDGRQWEQVSPVDKHGAIPLSISEATGAQSSPSGDALGYIVSAPTEEGAQGNGEGVQILSSRGAAGWSSEDISLPHSTPEGASGSGGHEYRFFSEDLSQAIVEPLGVEFASLAPQVFPPDTERTPYLRYDATCSSNSSSCFQPLLTEAPGYTDVPEGKAFGGGIGLRGQAEFMGATPDLTHVVISSKVPLTSTPTTGPGELYEWTAGKPAAEELRLISALPGPNDEPADNEAAFGHERRDGKETHGARHAISDDGTRIVWAEAGGHLYLRDTAKEETVQLDVPEAACVADGKCGDGEVNPEFQIASRNTSRIFFTDSQRLTENASTTGSDLYVCELVAGSCAPRDLTPPDPGQDADLRGSVLGASDDGSSVYYVANGVLDAGANPGNCVEGSEAEPPNARCNLYVSHYDGTTWEAPRLVTILSGDDRPDWAQQLPGLTARVSPNGQWLAFMSDLGLTGYDTRDAVSGEPDEEVYLYHAFAGGAGRLVCASCDPSGARPLGTEYAKLTGGLAGGNGLWTPNQWIAANIPGWSPYRAGAALYQSRFLSDQGRLFFNSGDALVSRDVNNNEDVYEFEPPGIGDCSEATSSGVSTYSSSSGGCTSLISSGRAAGESGFLDASESGEDVFFLTNAPLAGTDTDAALDVYDAHVCSAIAPCLNSSSSPPPCATADGCRAAPTPQPSIFGSPATATLSGAGNQATPPPPVASKLKVKALTRAQKLDKALKQCKRDKSKNKRVTCEKSAHHTYGAKPKSGKRLKGRK